MLRPSHHPRSQREHIRASVGAFVCGDGGMVIGEFGKLRFLGQLHRRHQSGGADQIGIIENDPAESRSTWTTHALLRQLL